MDLKNNFKQLLKDNQESFLEINTLEKNMKKQDFKKTLILNDLKIKDQILAEKEFEI